MKNNNWQEKKLGNIATFINGKAFKPSDWSDTGLPIIRIQNLTNSIDDIHYYNGDIEEKYRITTGDILISWSATIGVFEWLNGDAVLNQHIFKVVFDKEPIDKTFFKHLIKQKIDEMLKNVHGSTMKHITKGDFDNIDVLLPSLDEQKKIAKILDKADEIRAKKKLANDKLDEFLKSTFISMFGDPVKNPKKMPIADIAQLATTDNAIKAGPFGSSLKKECYVEKGYKIYGQEQVINNDVNYGDYYIDERKYNSLKMYKVIAGDVLISLVGSYGKLLIIPEQYHAGIINPRLMKITFDKDKINPIFFKYLFANETFQLLLNNNSHGGTMGILNVGIIKKLKIIVPPINEQNKFAKIVEHVEAQKQKNELVIEQMNNLFNSLSQRAFKGEI